MWHDRAMALLVSRSIDLMENLSKESNNAFGFETNQHGYLFVSNTPASGDDHHFNEFANGSTASEVRHHRSLDDTFHLDSLRSDASKTGIDLLWGPEVIARSFPHV